MSATVTYKGATLTTATNQTRTLDTAGTYLEDDITITDVTTSPTGTKNISITENGTTTEDVTSYASASITANVPNSYTASDEGKVVSNGSLVSQSSATYTENDTYDTTLIDEVTVNVSGGGGISVDDIAQNLQPSGAITLSNSVTSIPEYALAGKPITSIIAPSVTNLTSMCLQNTQITTIDDTNFPSLGVSSQYSVLLRMSSLQHITLSGQKITLSSGSGVLRDNANLVSAEFPHCAEDVGTSVRGMGNSAFYGDTKLEIVDIGSCGSIGNNAFYGCSKLTTIIMRKTSLVTLANANVFNGSPFKNGGTGGHIYIPKTLYDQLGTGTNDYEAATNWSTVNGWGTITWHPIEGSEYEL